MYLRWDSCPDQALGGYARVFLRGQLGPRYSRDATRGRMLLSHRRVQSLELSTSFEIHNPHRGVVNCLSLERHESRYLLSGGQYGTVSLTDLETFDAHSDISGVNVAKNLMSGVGPAPPPTTMNNNVGGRMISSLEWYPEDSGMFISSTFSGSLSVWDTNQFQVAYNFALNSGVLASKIRCNDNGALIAAGLGDSSVKLCDTRTGDSCLVLQGHKLSVSAVDWCPCNLYQLASSSLDGTLKVWDIRRGGNNPPVLACDWLQDHTTIARYGSVFTTIDGKRSRNPAVASSSTKQVKVGMGSTSAHTLYKSSDLDGDSSHMWTVDRYSEQIARAHTGAIFSMRYSPCGCYLLSAGGEGRVRLWDAATGRLQPVNYDLHVKNDSQAKLPYTMEIAQFSCAGDDLLLFPNGLRGDIAMVPLHSGTGLPVKVLRGHLGLVTSIVYRQAYHQVLSAGKDGMIFLWDACADYWKKKATKERARQHAGAANLELSFDVRALEDGTGTADYWSEDEEPGVRVGGPEGDMQVQAAGVASNSALSSSSSGRFMPPIVVRYLEDMQRSRAVASRLPFNASLDPAVRNNNSNNNNNSNGTETTAAAIIAARKLKINLRTKFGGTKRKR